MATGKGQEGGLQYLRAYLLSPSPSSLETIRSCQNWGVPAWNREEGNRGPAKARKEAAKPQPPPLHTHTRFCHRTPARARRPAGAKSHAGTGEGSCPPEQGPGELPGHGREWGRRSPSRRSPLGRPSRASSGARQSRLSGDPRQAARPPLPARPPRDRAGKVPATSQGRGGTAGAPGLGLPPVPGLRGRRGPAVRRPGPGPAPQLPRARSPPPGPAGLALCAAAGDARRGPSAPALGTKGRAARPGRPECGGGRSPSRAWGAQPGGAGLGRAQAGRAGPGGDRGVLTCRGTSPCRRRTRS
jgi:hypothetical protein